MYRNSYSKYSYLSVKPHSSALVAHLTEWMALRIVLVHLPH